MAGTTTNFSIPFPSVTDYVTNGATDMRLLAEKVDAVVPTGMRNLIINGNMQIDQRNAGTAINPIASAYTVDRWSYYGAVASKFSFQQNQGSVTPPIGFVNYAGFTSLSAYSVAATDQFLFEQKIEGYNISQLAWGTANAKPIVVSFWVRSSLTGTFGGAVRNSASNRSYPFSYSISAANTWEYKTIKINGDTTGTWLTTNGIGLSLTFSLGTGTTYSGTSGAWSATSFLTSVTGAVNVAGTNGATWQITGVQVEQSTQVTPFELKSYANNLRDCQRYFEKTYNLGTAVGTATRTGMVGNDVSSSNTNEYIIYRVRYEIRKRGAPTINTYDGAGNLGKATRYSLIGASADNTSMGADEIGENSFRAYIGTGLPNNAGFTFHYTAGAEL